MTFAEIIVPLPLNAVFTYQVPDTMAADMAIGARVIVPFGLRKFYTGIVESLTPVKPTGYEVKEIDRLIDAPGQAVLVNPQLKFWRWMADYYMCSIGEVMRAALPAALKLESETFIELDNDSDTAPDKLSQDEAMAYAALQHHSRLTLGELSKKTGLTASPERTVERLLKLGLVRVSEKVIERYRSRKQTVVTLPAESDTPQWRSEAFALTARSKHQERLLLTLLQMADAENHGVERQALLEKSGCSAAVLKALADKGILKIITREVNRFKADFTPQEVTLPTLSPAQTDARNSLLDQWEQGQRVNLLRGITSSGKTEIYIHLIDRVLRAGKQVLFLVPEIALTTQLTQRLQRVFGSKVLVYHSKFTDNERADIWRQLLTDHSPRLIVGARSAIFLPFAKLGLTIVDEEHEASYKQFDPAPRYNARDAAIYLASLHDAKVLLGSASPSVETYHKAQSGRYGLTELTERYGGVCLPDIEIVDMKREMQRTRSSRPLAGKVAADILDATGHRQQAIVFHNRRGFAPLARCKACAYIPKCECCDVSLTYHRYENRLICHYCGATYSLPTLCPVCGEPQIEVVGYGTERIEEEIQEALPGRKILRMDLDTTRNKDGYQEIINAFSAHRADILVGTQMVTKGLDFSDVSIVAVINADMLINIPDFRSAERAFNMMLQVAGRAGRRDTPGKVVIQTYQPDHPVIGYVKTHDYLGFYGHELQERQQRNYPPFSRMIVVTLRHKDERFLIEMADIYGERLRTLLGQRVFGPEKPIVARVQNQCIRRFMLKFELTASMPKVRALLHDTYRQLQCEYPHLRSVAIAYDVDPA